MSSGSYEPYDKVVTRLSGAKRSPNGHVAKCPSHDDRKASLSISAGHDGRVLLHCFAGCSTEQILSRLGLSISDLFPRNRSDNNPKSRRDKEARQIVTEYSYPNEEGEVLYQVTRSENKVFRQRRPDRNGRWVYNLGDTRRVLFRLPDLNAADHSEPVFIVEGEKDVNRLVELGLVATTNAGGAGKWRPEYSECLRNRSVVILPDNDKPGRDHAFKVAHALQGLATSVKIVELPGLPEKGDVSDWLDAGGNGVMLIEIVNSTGEWQQSEVESHKPDVGFQGYYPSFNALHDARTTAAEEILVGVRRGQVGALVSSTNIGKTTLALNHCLLLAAGEGIAHGGTRLPLLLDSSPPRRILYVDCEATTDELKADVHRMLAGVLRQETAQGNLAFVVEGMIDGDPVDLSRREHMDYIIEAAKDHKADLVVIDTISSAFELTDENSNAQIRSMVMKPLLRLAREAKCAVLYAHHRGKAGETQTQEKAYHGRGASAFGALARAVFTLERYPKAGDGYIKLECVKAKGRSFEPVLLRHDFESRWFVVASDIPTESTMLTANMIADFVQSKGEARTREIIDEFDRFAQATVKRRIDDAKHLRFIEPVRQGKYRVGPEYQSVSSERFGGATDSDISRAALWEQAGASPPALGDQSM